MSWRVVAREDLRRSLRSRALAALLGLFVVATVAVVVGYRLVAPRPGAATLLAYLLELSRWLAPITALVVGYRATVGERERRTLPLLLGLSESRASVLGGTLAGRAVAVAVPVVVAFAAGLPLAMALYPGLAVLEYAVVAALTVVLAVAVTGLAVGISAVTASPVRAAAMAMGSFVAFTFLWDLLPAGAYYLLEGSLPGSRLPPDWFFLLRRLNPLHAYDATVAAALPAFETGAPAGGAAYLGWGVALLVLVTWAALPVAVGYYRFSRADLQ